MAPTTFSTEFLQEIVSPDDPQVDIVAVHGLNPANTENHAEYTWTARGTKKLWLRDFLPHQCPQVRVLLFGYNSNVAFKTSTAGVREQAESLLNRLKLKRIGVSQRPIVFICHSLGGIVVKRALVEAKLNISYDNIRSETYGIVFFATPHRGGNHAKLGDIAASIVKLVLQNEDNTFMEALKKDSLFAQGVSDDFRHQLKDYRVISFYETLAYKKFGIVVDKNSATLGLDGLHETQIGIAADHRSICKFERAEGHDYEQVGRNIQELIDGAIRTFKEQKRVQISSFPPPSLSLNSTFICPYSENTNFVGREPELELLKQKFSHDKYEGWRNQPAPSSERIAVLWGLGGVGKSQIAIQYIYRLRRQHPEISIYWVNGATADRFREGYIRIAREHQIPGMDTPNVDRFQYVKQWLQETGPWFMVIDNADDLQTLFDTTDCETTVENSTQQKLGYYIPNCAHGYVLITTRTKDVACKFPFQSRIEVHSLSKEESEELIKKNLTGQTYGSSDMGSLVSLLGHLPLALVQASAYIEQNSLTVKEYLDIYHESEDSASKLLSESFESDGRDPQIPNAVATSWMISFDNIKAASPRAAEILAMSAFFDQLAIPESLVRNQGESILSLKEAMGKLVAYSLITKNTGNMHFDMHQLVHKIARMWRERQEDASKWSTAALERVFERFPKEEYDSWDLCASYLPHAESVIREQLGKHGDRYSMSLDGLLKAVSNYLQRRGYYQSSHDIAAKLYRYRLAHLGSENADFLNSVDDLALSLWSRGKYGEAIVLERQNLERRENLLGPEHVSTLMTLNHLATLLELQDKDGEAEELSLRAVHSTERFLGPEHLLTLRSVSNLAILLRKQGKYEKAQALHQRSIEGMEKALGPKHPSTLWSVRNLARVHMDLRQYNEAQRLTRRVFKGREEALGLEHPDTLECIADMGCIEGLKGNYQEAEVRYRQALMGRERILGLEHRETISNRAHLAAILKRQAKFEEAEGLTRRVLTEREKILGPLDPSTLRTAAILALLLVDRGKLAEAEGLGRHTLVGRQKALGLNHPDTLRSAAALADTLRRKSKRKRLRRWIVARVGGVSTLMSTELH